MTDQYVPDEAIVRFIVRQKDDKKWVISTHSGKGPVERLTFDTQDEAVRMLTSMFPNDSVKQTERIYDVDFRPKGDGYYLINKTEPNTGMEYWVYRTNTEAPAKEGYFTRKYDNDYLVALVRSKREAVSYVKTANQNLEREASNPNVVQDDNTGEQT